MKKLIIAMLAVTLLFSGCGKKEAAETTVPPTTEAVVETTEVATEATEIATATTEPEPTIPEVTEEATEAPTEPSGEPGTVIRTSKLNVREAPSVNAKRLMQLEKGTRVTVYEVEKAAGMTWGRIEQGWVSMEYIQLDNSGTQLPEKEHQSVPPQNSSPENDSSQSEVPQSNVPQHDGDQEDSNKDPAQRPDTPAPTTPVAPPAPIPDDKEEPTEPAPTECAHGNWIATNNIPAEYEDRHYVACTCGAKFSSSAEWAAHRDSHLNTEELVNHTGYSSGTERVQTAPAKVVWQCTGCGIFKTTNINEKP